MTTPMFTGPITLSSGEAPPSVLKIEPDDVIIIQAPKHMKEAQMKALMDGFKKLFPGHKVCVLPNGTHVSTARPPEIAIA